jgi:DNA-binding NarL/FixJ family response regulator
VILAVHELDAESLAALLRTDHALEVLCATASAEYAFTMCRYQCPQVIVCDAALADRPEWQYVVTFVRQHKAVPVLLLDVDVNLGRLATAMTLPAAGYFTRGASWRELAAGLRRLACGEPVFEAAVYQSLEKTSQGWQVVYPSGDSPAPHRAESPLARLTPRETEVLRLIAMGRSVRDCAEILSLAHSTVDNHKSRLMKKLGLRKSQDLTLLAVREGLIRI